jgi:hypothetical protein
MMSAGYQEVQTTRTPLIDPRWGNLYGPFLQTQIPAEPPSDRAHQPSQALAAFKSLEQQMAQLVSEQETILNEVRKRYVLLPYSPEVTFLIEHRTLPQLLLAAESPLRQAFGSDTIFFLRAPIDESGARTLYAVAVWPGAVADARTALQQFDDTWWLAHARPAAGRLTFTYELV